MLKNFTLLWINPLMEIEHWKNSGKIIASDKFQIKSFGKKKFP